MTKYPAKYHPRARGNTVSLLVFKVAEHVSPARAWEAGDSGTQTSGTKPYHPRAHGKQV